MNVSFGTGSPGVARTKGRKTVVIVVVVLPGGMGEGAHFAIWAIQHVSSGYTSESAIHGQCNARPVVTFLTVLA